MKKNVRSNFLLHLKHNASFISETNCFSLFKVVIRRRFVGRTLHLSLVGHSILKVCRMHVNFSWVMRMQFTSHASLSLLTIMWNFQVNEHDDQGFHGIKVQRNSIFERTAFAWRKFSFYDMTRYFFCVLTLRLPLNHFPNEENILFRGNENELSRIKRSQFETLRST